MVDKKLKVLQMDAPQDMLVTAVEVAAGLIDNKTAINEVARDIKKAFDTQYFPN